MHPSYRRRFLQENRELADAVKTMKRNLGLDIREDILEQQAIIDSIDKINTDPSGLIRTQLEGVFSSRELNIPKDTVVGLQNRMAIFDEAIRNLDRLDAFVGARVNPGYNMDRDWETHLQVVFL